MERVSEREKERRSEYSNVPVPEQIRTRVCCSGRLAPSPDAGSLPLLLMIMKLVCVQLRVPIPMIY